MLTKTREMESIRDRGKPTFLPIAERILDLSPRLAPRVAEPRGHLATFLHSAFWVAVPVALGVLALLGLALGARLPAVGSDPGTALSTAKAAVGGNHQWVEMLAPPIQVAAYIPFVSIGQPEFATAVPVIFGALVLLLVFVAAWRVTGMPWAGAIAGLFLLSTPEYWQRASLLPAYQTFVFFGYLGLFLTATALRSPRRSTVFAIAGGVALALSAYSFTTGLVFLPAALFLALVWKGRWRPALLSLSTAAVLLLPFAVWHIAVVGIRNAWIYPHNFLVVKYSEDLRIFWNRPDYDIFGYVGQALPDMLLRAAPIWLWLLAAAGLLVIGKVHSARVSAIVAAAMLTPLIPYVALHPAPFPRYAYMLLPGLVVVAAVGLALAVQSMARHRAGRHVSMLAPPVIALLAIYAATTALSTHLDVVADARASPRYAELQIVASEVDDGRALLARSSEMQVLLPDNQIYTLNFFTEDEYIDYILWRDEERVRRFLARWDIGWVILQRGFERLERDYNLWATTATGYPPRHYICLPQSEGFSEVYSGRYVVLYKVDQNWLRSGDVQAASAAADGRPAGSQDGEPGKEGLPASGEDCPGN